MTFDISPEYYHVECFEKIADLSVPEVLCRLQPLTRSNFQTRNAEASILKAWQSLCDGGAERLILEWKIRRWALICDREGVEPMSLDVAFRYTLLRAGSATFAARPVPGMRQYDHFLLTGWLAPIESDGPGDAQEWNLFDEYLGVNDNVESLNERHSLSGMLHRWKYDSVRKNGTLCIVDSFFSFLFLPLIIARIVSPIKSFRHCFSRSGRPVN